MYFFFRPKSKSPKEVEDDKHTRALLETDLTNQIRVILCQDTGDKAKLTLFDSDYVPQKRKAAHNIDLICEMMFGTVPLSYKGMTTKIHYIKSPKPQILLTKLFSINPSNLETNVPKSNQMTNLTFSGYRSGSSDEDPFHAISSPSMYNSGQSTFGLRNNSLTLNSSSSLSLSTSTTTFHHRRIRRFSQTSIENGIFNPTPLPGCSSRFDSFGGNLNFKHPVRSWIYSVGIVISLEDNELLEDFVFSHFALLENKLHQLQSNAFRVLCHLLRKSQPPLTINTNRYKISMLSLPEFSLQQEPSWLEAVNKFRTSMYQLYSTPRIQPLWLNISTFQQKRSLLAKSLLEELSYLLEKFDNISSNFFMSTLISGVLMSHLAWIPTVVPMADVEERIHKNLFYDPLWAQLGDLYGNIGTSPTMSRTIIIGSDVNTVRRILFVLSYFMRCNEVNESVEDMSPSDYLNLERRRSLGRSERSQREASAKDPGEKEMSCVEVNSNQTKRQSVDDSAENDFRKEINYCGRRSSTENRRKSLIIDSPFTNIFVDDFLDVPMPKYEGYFLKENKRINLSQPPITIPDPSLNREDDTSKIPHRADRLFAKSYGRSLMVGHCDKYMPDFVLMGLPQYDFQDALETDLKDSLQMQPFSSQDPVSRSICILGQLKSFKVSVFGYEHENLHNGGSSFTVQKGHIREGNGYFIPLHFSKYVFTMLHQCKELYNKADIPAESCLEYMEDQLRILYYKAVTYKKMAMFTSGSSSPISASIFSPTRVDEVPLDVLEALELQESDIPLLSRVTRSESREDM
ncbi:2959_t:CDS:10 [Acaulospora morrowiae]|uniref:2959_t:CDS:1 n=1 Tax=Acaulospora morrowiae TaxID=94023 RepID=A0A9N9B8Q2_9GLOM|nr:2959_t:CDS:10 [Acaulospora morrowiae]